MRTIKYRAFDDIAQCMRNNVFFDGQWWGYKGDNHGTILDYNVNIKVGNKKGGHPPVMQFTGLYDKNGQDIYEGDILKMKNQSLDIGIIKHIGNGFWIENLCGNNFIPSKEYMEIIGNIHENPELLK